MYLGNLRGRRSFSITRLININKFTYQGRVQPNPYPQKQRQGVLITFNRPAEMNAFGRPLMVELRQALDRAVADPEIRAIVLTGAGRGFSAGMDQGSSRTLRSPRKTR